MSSPRNEDSANRREALRRELTEAESARDAWRAMQAARELLQADASPRIFRTLRTLADRWPADDARLPTLRVALLSSFSIEFTHDALIATAFASGLRVTIYQPGFGLFRQQLLDPASGLYRFQPDAVVLAVEGEDWCPSAYSGFGATSDSGKADPNVAFEAELRRCLHAFRERSSAPILVHNLAQPRFTAMGIADWSGKSGQRSLIARLNEVVAVLAAEVPSTYVVDYAGLVNGVGASNWYDRRMSLFAHAPIAAPALGPLAREWCKFLRAIRGLNRKCLVLDLDNTLWGGVVGEDGVGGIQLGPTYPGNAYAEFQSAILGLQRRGVILAVASKNNRPDVDEVFERHDFMSLRREHFSAWQVHWGPKPESLREIARSLNIGLEHLVFADDNPAECDAVRMTLPMVTIIPLPREPERFVEALLQDGWFDSVTLSAEDRRRSELYQQRDLADASRAAFVSVEDFLRDLQMELVFADVTPETLARTAQLTQKTNQFNATTRRYSEADIAGRLADPSWLIGTVSVKDRFGDNGIVGVLMARHCGGDLEVDTFLLSCRVIGRAVETAMLAWLCERAAGRGAVRVAGTIVPTAKNAPVRGVFESHGFVRSREDATGATQWHLTLSERSVEWPDWFRVDRRHAPATQPESAQA